MLICADSLMLHAQVPFHLWFLFLSLTACPALTQCLQFQAASLPTACASPCCLSKDALTP